MILDPDRFDRPTPPRIIMEGGCFTEAATPEERRLLPAIYARRIAEEEAAEAAMGVTEQMKRERDAYVIAYCAAIRSPIRRDRNTIKSKKAKRDQQ